MRRRGLISWAAGLVLVAGSFAMSASAAPEQHGGPGGHLPGGSSNVQLVSKLFVHNADAGRISDVAVFGNYAYLGAYFQGQPACQKGGVYVIDISNLSKPKEVQFIPSANDTYVSEGVQVLHVDTADFNGDLLVHNNEACDPNSVFHEQSDQTPIGAETHGIGGIGLVDVTDPLHASLLSDGLGDTDPATTLTTNGVHEYHSVFAWDAGARAYAIGVDDQETGSLGGLDVDIFDITDPRHPVVIKETGLPDWPGAQDSQSAGTGNFPFSFLHDLQVRQFGSKWLALLSYWDAGWVVLDVTNPANPVFVDDTTYNDPDVLTGVSPAEGNAHQAWWNADGKFFLGTDEDFDPYRFEARITSGPFSGQQFSLTQGSDVPQVVTGSPLAGPTRFVGQACSTLSGAALPQGPGEIAVIERGTCTFTTKATNVTAAGYIGGIVFNSDSSLSSAPICEGFVSMLVQGTIPFLFTNRSSGMRILGVTGYDPSLCNGSGATNSFLPAIGAGGSSVNINADTFDGWGYLHLYDATTLNEIDAFAIPEALNPAFATGFGDLSVHEVESDDSRADLMYSSYYAGGFRVFRISRAAGIEQVGFYIDANGNNFWGLDPFTRNGQSYVALSDRDSGLWIFRYTGP